MIKEEKCPRCNSVLEKIGRCGYCHNDDCTVHHVQFRPEFNDCLMCTDSRKGEHNGNE